MDSGTRAIDRVGFDRFSFEAPQIRHDGAVLQRGTDAAGCVILVGSVPWPDMPTDWLAMSSRRGDDHLELDVGDPPIVDPDLAERFVIDTDDDDLTDLLHEAAGSWIISTDDEVGPIHVVLDGPDPDEDHVPTLFVACLEPEHDDDVDVRDLAVAARRAFSRRS